MIGVTEPPFICRRCGEISDSLTGISQHELACMPAAIRRRQPGQSYRGPVAAEPLGDPSGRKPVKKLPPVKKLKVGTTGKALNCPPPYCLIPQPPQAAPKPAPPPKPEPPKPEPQPEPWTWFGFRVRCFIKLYAFEHYWLSRHLRREAKRERHLQEQAKKQRYRPRRRRPDADVLCGPVLGRRGGGVY